MPATCGFGMMINSSRGGVRAAVLASFAHISLDGARWLIFWHTNFLSRASLYISIFISCSIACKRKRVKGDSYKNTGLLKRLASPCCILNAPCSSARTDASFRAAQHVRAYANKDRSPTALSQCYEKVRPGVYRSGRPYAARAYRFDARQRNRPGHAAANLPPPGGNHRASSEILPGVPGPVCRHRRSAHSNTIGTRHARRAHETGAVVRGQNGQRPQSPLLLHWVYRCQPRSPKYPRVCPAHRLENGSSRGPSRPRSVLPSP